jgi:hypothetical protein
MAAMLAWLAVGGPALEHRTSRRDSLKTFAVAAVARVPPETPLAFFAEPIRSVVVYSGRTIPTCVGGRTSGRNRAIVRKSAYRRLARAGLVGPPLLAGHGGQANIRRERGAPGPYEGAA